MTPYPSLAYDALQVRIEVRLISDTLSKQCHVFDRTRSCRTVRESGADSDCVCGLRGRELLVRHCLPLPYLKLYSTSTAFINFIFLISVSCLEEGERLKVSVWDVEEGLVKRGASLTIIPSPTTAVNAPLPDEVQYSSSSSLYT